MDDVLLNLVTNMPQALGLLLLVWFLWQIFQLVWNAWSVSRTELRDCYEHRMRLEAELKMRENEKTL